LIAALRAAETERSGGQKFIFPTPLFLFARLLGLRPVFFGGKLSFLFSRLCPAHPDVDDNKELPKIC